MLLDECLKKIVELGASDLHLKSGRPPMMRLRGDIVPMEGQEPLVSEEVQRQIYSVTNSVQQKHLEEQKELDFSFNIKGLARFRGNVFYQRGSLSAVFRVIPTKAPSVEDLGLPSVLKELVSRPQGLFLVTGPTGSGKSTTLASLVQFVNENFSKHIITIEDPIEFAYADAKCIVNQREIGTDTSDFVQALRRALRQDPDVILMGELRDRETIATAITAAETGHLVMGTIHTNDAKQTIDRIVDTFPGDSQNQIRLQVAAALIAIVSQRLIKRKDGKGRVAAAEIMINSPMIKKLIEDNKAGQISKVIEESATYYKMQTFNQALFGLVKDDKITVDEALRISENPNDLKIKFQTQGISIAQAAQVPPGLAAGK